MQLILRIDGCDVDIKKAEIHEHLLPMLKEIQRYIKENLDLKCNYSLHYGEVEY